MRRKNAFYFLSFSLSLLTCDLIASVLCYASSALSRKLEVAGGRKRWDNYYYPPPLAVHPPRSRNYSRVYGHPEFGEMFRMYDAESLQAPVEVRFPFMDLRLLRFLLTVPPIPWYHSKYLLRRAMNGKLPDLVLRRPKETIQTSLIMEHIERGRKPLVKIAPELSSYVDAERLPTVAPDDMWTAGRIMLARLFNHWLQCSYRSE